MGADAQLVAFSEVYTALERGILDAGVTGASPGFSQRWYEVTEFMNGRLISFNSTTNVIKSMVTCGPRYPRTYRPSSLRKAPSTSWKPCA